MHPIRYKRRPSFLTLLYLVAGLLLTRLLYIRLSPFLHVQLYHIQWHNHAFLYLVGAASFLSKEPLIQVVDRESIDVVFEIRHDPQKFARGQISEPQVMVHWTPCSTASMHQSPATVLHDGAEVRVYRARLSDALLAECGIAYRIVIESWQSKLFESPLFSAAADEKRRALHFGVVGDNQFAAVKFMKILSTLVATPPAGTTLDGMIHLGDAVQDAASARSWSTDFWAPIAHFRLLTRPWIMLRGNHDAPSAYTSQPRKHDGGGYASFNLAATKTFIVVLDANSDSELQHRALAATLASDAAQSAHRRIVLVHIPPFVEFWDPVPWRSGEKLWGAFVRTLWVPLFERYHVDLVISGHQHNYQRATKAGVTYVIAGGAGGTLDHARVEDYGLRDTVLVIDHHFGLLTLDPQFGIHWRVYRTDGSLVDDIMI